MPHAIGHNAGIGKVESTRALGRAMMWSITCPRQEGENAVVLMGSAWSSQGLVRKPISWDIGQVM
jgi:hypothetical protein